MGLGIIGSDLDVPGTVPGFLEREKTLEQVFRGRGARGTAAQPSSSASLNPNLKYDTSGPFPILLVPQPTDDPQDPLNLPRWRRDLNLLILCIMGVLATTLSPILAADSLDLTFYFETSFTKIAWLTGYHLLAVGLSGFIFVGTARVWGKRHVYIIGSLLVIASCVWGGEANSYGSLMGARVLQGVGLAPFEALINSSVADLYFVHERGWRMAISNLSVFGGAFFTPVIVGVIESTLGWPWTFKFVAIFAGAVFPLLFLFCFETAYPRSINAEQEALAAVGAAQVRRTDQVHVSNASSEPDADSTEKEAAATTTTGARLANTEPWSFKKSLSPFNGRKTDEHFLKVLIRPLPLFLNPGILWACFIQGCIIGWTVLIGIVIAAIFLGPPLFFTSRQAGYLYAGAFIGAIAGFLICGLVADPGIRLLTRLNNGVYEPEFRILLVGFLSLVFGAIGLYGFGYTSADQYRWGWLIPDVFFGFEVAGMVCGAIASALYIADAHRDVAIEGFTCLLIFKNLFSFGLTLHGFDWLATRGITQVFVIVASVHVGISALSFPMYFFGKLNRKYSAKYDILKVLRLR